MRFVWPTTINKEELSSEFANLWLTFHVCHGPDIANQSKTPNDRTRSSMWKMQWTKILPNESVHSHILSYVSLPRISAMSKFSLPCASLRMLVPEWDCLTHHPTVAFSYVRTYVWVATGIRTTGEPPKSRFTELKMIVAFAGERFRKHWLAGRNLAGKPTVKFYVYGTHETT